MAGLSLAVCAIALAESVSAVTPRPDSVVPRLRPLDGWAKALLARGVEQSPTFRALVDRLAEADVIVYVEMGPKVASAPGALRFVGVSASFRFVHIALHQSLTHAELVGVLGHELHHAVEVAGAPHIRDEESLRRFYRAHGEPGRGLGAYDSEGAREAGHRVRQEVAGSRPEPGVAPGG